MQEFIKYKPRPGHNDFEENIARAKELSLLHEGAVVEMDTWDHIPLHIDATSTLKEVYKQYERKSKLLEASKQSLREGDKGRKGPPGRS